MNETQPRIYDPNNQLQNIEFETSSLLEVLAYRPLHQQLFAKFKKGGNVVVYAPVPQNVADELAAEGAKLGGSIGSTFSSLIKKYAYPINEVPHDLDKHRYTFAYIREMPTE